MDPTYGKLTRDMIKGEAEEASFCIADTGSSHFFRRMSTKIARMAATNTPMPTPA